MANKKSSFSVKRLIYNDKYLIIFALALAVVIWIGTSLSVGVDESKTVNISVPISLGDEVSDQLGMQYYSIQNSVDLSVTITGPKYVIGQVTENDFDVKFDTSSVSRTGEQTIPILVSNASKSLDFDVASVYPSSIEGYFDVDETRTFDVDLFYDKSNVADGYIFGEPILSEDKIQVSGPKTYIDKVDGVSVQVNFGDSVDLKELFKTDCKIEIDGSNLETSYLKVTSRSDNKTELKAISVNIPVLKVKELPVKVDVEDIPSGFDTDDLDISYSENEIEAGVLDSADITSAVIGTIDFNQLKNGRNEFTFDVTSLQGITVLDSQLKKIDVVVNVNGSFKTQNVYPSRSDLIVEGVPSGYEANVSSLSKYSVSAIIPADETVRLSDIEMKCDVSVKNEDNTYPVVITVKNKDKAWIYGEYTAVIELREKD